MFGNNNFSYPGSIGINGAATAGRGITLGGILSGATRTLNFVNQALPLAYKIGPLAKNARTMLKLAGEFKKIDAPTTSNTKALPTNNKVNTISSNTSNNAMKTSSIKPMKTAGPMFFQ